MISSANSRHLLLGFVSAAIVFVSAGCSKSKPSFTYMPDMAYSPAYKAQELMLAPPKGTVPRGFQPYAYATDPEAAGRELKNPVTPTKTILGRGQEMFRIYCSVCHGPAGEGDGTVVPKFPRPPSLHNEKVVGWTDGRIYHVISAGQNLMPSYASQVDSADRWAIIHYIRALQRAKNPTAQDLKSASR